VAVNKFMTEALVVAVVTPMKDKTREALLKGKAQYQWPPYTKNFRSAPFYTENFIYFKKNKLS
jgi:hypothetical protein